MILRRAVCLGVLSPVQAALPSDQVVYSAPPTSAFARTTPVVSAYPLFSFPVSCYSVDAVAVCVTKRPPSPPTIVPAMAFVAAAPLSLNRRPASLMLGAASSPALTGGYPVCPAPLSVVVARQAEAKWSMARVAKVRGPRPVYRVDREEMPSELRTGDLASSKHPEGYVALGTEPW